jgi:hypothetical protein
MAAERWLDVIKKAEKNCIIQDGMNRIIRKEIGFFLESIYTVPKHLFWI